MPEIKSYSFIDKRGNSTVLFNRTQSLFDRRTSAKKQLKKELMNLFRKFGYIEEGKDYEVKIKTTSGNIAWININSIEIIK